LFQDLVSTEAGHHDVEHYEVEPLISEKLECLEAILGSRDIPISLELEQHCQGVSVVLNIVDNQQLRALIAHFSPFMAGGRNDAASIPNLAFI
jgi:hypothetical protein